MRRYFGVVWMLCKTLTKRWFRDPVALFFTLVFPLIFLLVFGAMSRSSSVSFKVAVIDHSKTPFAEQFITDIRKDKVFKIKTVADVAQAKDQMGHGELDSIIELPPTFGVVDVKGVPQGNVVVYYQASNPDTGQTVAATMKQMLDGINAKLTGATMPLNVVEQPTKTANLTRFDYTMSGIVGFSILSLAVFGMANGFPSDKKTGSLRRMRATPLRASQLILATALEYLLIGGMTVAILFTVGTLLFGFHMRGSYLTLAVFSAIGIFCLFGFGMAIGGWAKNENQSAPLANLVAFPMMFLSGVFFPTFLMPSWVQAIARYIPLTPVIEGIRRISTENASLFSLGPELAIIGVWAVIIYAIAFRVFRWE